MVNIPPHQSCYSWPWEYILTPGPRPSANGFPVLQEQSPSIWHRVPDEENMMGPSNKNTHLEIHRQAQELNTNPCFQVHELRQDVQMRSEYDQR